MAKIKHLSSEHLISLRKAVKEQFEKADAFHRPLKANAYLPNYEAMQSDMHYVLTNDLSHSVGKARLRKLFYYTNPTICDEKHIQEPRFGEDFLDACCFYISDKKLTFSDWVEKENGTASLEKAVKKIKYEWIFLAAALTGAIIVSCWLFQSRKSEKAWKETFVDTDLERLRKEGWEVLFYDSILWNKQLRKGCLTTYTTPGSLWVTEPDSYASIDNLLIKKISSNCFSVIIKLVNFNPSEPYQQAGIVLLENKKKMLPYLKVSSYGTGRKLEFEAFHNSVSAIGHVAGSSEKMESFVNQSIGLQHPIQLPIANQIDTTWIKVDVTKDSFSFFIKVNNPNREYQRHYNPKEGRGKFPLPVDIRYVGIGAWGAGSKVYPLSETDTISCFIDEISFCPCGLCS